MKTTDLRKLAISTLGSTCKHQPVVDAAREMYAQWKVNPAAVDSDVFASMVYVLAENGDKALYDEFNDKR